MNVSLDHMPHLAVAETSANSSRSSVDVLEQTSSTAIRDTEVQFLNDSVAVGSKPLVSHGHRRPRIHCVNVTIPTDIRPPTTNSQPHIISQPNITNPRAYRNDSTSLHAHTNSRVTFQDPSVSSAVVMTNGIASGVVTDRQMNDTVLPSSDRGEQTLPVL